MATPKARIQPNTNKAADDKAAAEQKAADDKAAAEQKAADDKAAAEQKAEADAEESEAQRDAAVAAARKQLEDEAAELAAANQPRSVVAIKTGYYKRIREPGVEFSVPADFPEATWYVDADTVSKREVADLKNLDTDNELIDHGPNSESE